MVSEAVIPLGLKIVYTPFVCALVPIYWRQYGHANFLWFSDIGLLALVPAFICRRTFFRQNVSSSRIVTL